jgi:predicted ATPase
MQLTQIGLKNFRVFEEAQLDIRPITIITGANSSGKSSVFKALMLLEDNVEKNQLAELDFSGSNHSLGSYELIKNIKSKASDDLIFHLYLDNSKDRNKDFEYAEGFIFKYHYTKSKKRKDNGFLYKLTISSVYKNEKRELKEANLLEINLDKTSFSVCSLQIDLLSILKIISSNNAFFKDNFKLQMYPIRNAISNDTIQKEQNKRIKETEKENQDKINNIEKHLNEEQKKNLKVIDEKYEKQINESTQKRLSTNDIDEINDLEAKIADNKKYQEDEKNELLTQIKENFYQIYKEEIEALNDDPKFRDKIYQEIFHQIQDAIFPFVRNSIVLKLKKIQFETRRNLINSIFENTLWKTDIEQLILQLDKVTLEKILDWKKIQFAKKEIKDITISQIISKVILKKEEGAEVSQQNFFEFLLINVIESIVKLSVTDLPFISLPTYRAYQSQTYNIATKRSLIEHIITEYLDLKYKDLPPKNRTKKFIQTWFVKFGIGNDFFLEPVINVGTEFYFKIKKDNQIFNLADLGFGIAQIIPIILTCATAQEGTLICIEEPETNLHPKFQSMLAELFVDAHNTFKVQFALETHSEYLIRKLQEIVANESPEWKDFTNDKALIYYFRSLDYHLKANEQRFERIDFEADGKIDYWKFGSGFYDTDYILDFGLLNVQRKRFFNVLSNLKQTFQQPNQDDEALLKIIEERTDWFIETTDFQNYRNKIEIDLGQSCLTKLDNLTQDYLISAEFLLQTHHNSGDFSPVIAQFGRAVEYELVLFINCLKNDLTNYSNLNTDLINAKAYRLLIEKGELEDKFKDK